jgi:hypothetical protein
LECIRPALSEPRIMMFERDFMTAERARWVAAALLNATD